MQHGPQGSAKARGESGLHRLGHLVFAGVTSDLERGLGECDPSKIELYWIRDNEIVPVKNLNEIKRYRDRKSVV
jgi:hypothetical protein